VSHLGRIVTTIHVPNEERARAEGAWLDDAEQSQTQRQSEQVQEANVAESRGALARLSVGGLTVSGASRVR
jgi:hypothetical protein